jgi:rhamnosyltransferase
MSGSQSSPEVTVVLSAYNGARHIAEQIQSVCGQSFRNWRLVVRDDGSSDETVAIVKELIKKDSRISLIESSSARLGPTASFAALLETVHANGAERAFLCDQDDFWRPRKMEQQLSLLRADRSRNGGERPLLAHSDPEVVDDSLKLIHPSFAEFQRMSYNEADPLETLLIHNAVVGCTVGVNRSLLDFALPIPAGTRHDWWLALCAAATGGILRSETQVLYRQHATNVIGAVHRHAFVRDLMRNPVTYPASSFREFAAGVDQAIRLRERMQQKGLDKEPAFARVARYCDAFASDKMMPSRLRALKQSGARPQRAVSQVILYGLAALFPLARPLLRS